MVTKKTPKKSEYIPGEDIPIATDAKAFRTKKKSAIYPIVVRGTHLTTTTHEDGTIELEWDDEQLLKEVREACASVEQVKPVTKKKVKK